MVDKALFSTGNQEHETPQDLYDQLHREFGFDLDPASTEANHKAVNYFTKEDDGLSKDWTVFGNGYMGGRVYCNPPYGREIGKWVAKARQEVESGNARIVVMLLPARTDTRWFHDYIWDLKNHKPQSGVEIRFLKGRLQFQRTKSSAPFPSMIIIFTKS